MRKPLVLLFFIVLVSGIFFAQKIEITNPKGGEMWCKGTDTIHIAWNSHSDLTNARIKIRLFLYGNQVYKIADNVANTGSFNWPIPATIASSFYYQIKVKTIGLEEDDLSEKFRIDSCRYNPDLAIENSWVEPQHKYAGNEITYKAKILNLKPAELIKNRSNAQLKIERPKGLNTLTIPLQVKAFSSPNSQPQILAYPFIPQKSGVYKFILKLDIDNEVKETNENNNSDTHQAAVSPGADLIVCLTCGKRPGACKKTSITAWVRNIGKAPSKACKLHFHVKERRTTTHNVPSLQPNQMVSFKRTAKYCDPAHFGWKTMWAHVNKDQTVLEANYQNNYVKTRYKVASGDAYGSCSCGEEYKFSHELGYGEITQTACCSIKRNQ